MNNEFKQTEIGLIPEDWDVARLGEVISNIMSGDWGVGKGGNEQGLLKCQVIRGTDFPNLEKNILLGVPERFIKRSSFDKRMLRPEDLLIEISGGSEDQPTGRIFYVDRSLLEQTSVPLLFTNFVKLIRVNEEIVFSEYIYRYWQYLYNKGKTRIYEKQTTNIRNFKYKEFLDNEFIPLPSLPEQQKIASVLSKIQQAIEQQDKIISATKNLKKSLMKKLFTEGLGHTEFKETEIGQIPKDWEVTRLGDITEKTKQADPKRKPDNRFQYIDVSSISNKIFKIVELKEYLGKDAPSRARKLVKTDDIIFATVRPYLKRVAIVPETLNGEICSTAFCVIRCKKNIMDSRFVFNYLLLDSFVDKVSELQRGSSYPAVTDKDIKNQKIPLPPLPEQQQIAHILSTIDKKIETEEKRKATLKELFKTMLHKLITGGIRLKNIEI